MYLEERALTCQTLKNDIEKQLKEVAVKQNYEEFRFADIKGMPRAKVKLRE